VIDAASAEPLGAVVVRLFDPRSMRAAERKTTSEGTYEFAGIADGSYTVTASSETHGRSCYGAVDRYRMQCVSVSVVRDQRLSAVDFRMPRGASIRGVVLDHEGRPVAGAGVASQLGIASGNRAVTARDGSFELTNLMPGEDRLAVQPPATPGASQPPLAFYPLGGQFLEVASGERITGVTIVLPYIAFSSITANVSSSTSDITDVTAMVASATPRMSRRLDLSAEGTGTIDGLREGRYFVYARAQTPRGTVAAFEVVDLVEGGYDVALRLAPIGRITGRIVAERGGIPPVDGLRVEAVWVYDGVSVEPLGRDEVDVGPDGHFEIDRLFGTRILQISGLSPEWRVQAVRHGRTDVISAGVDVAAAATVDVIIVVSRQ
jgi:hypothetical protein